MARAAASKAGPRFAEVAGRARCSEAGRRLFFLAMRVRRIGFLCLLQSFYHGVQRGIEDDRRMPERIQARAFTLVRSTMKKIAAMETHGKVGILEEVPGEDQDHRFFWLHEPEPQQFLQASESNGGGRLTANAFCANFGFGLSNLEFAYLVAGATGGLKDLYSFLPRSGVADADRRGPSFSLHANQMLPSTFAESSHQRIGTLGLNHGQ